MVVIYQNFYDTIEHKNSPTPHIIITIKLNAFMFQEFCNYYLKKAAYELIENGKTYYGEVPSLRGVWATGKTIEECRENLLNVLEGWLILRLQRNMPIPNFKLSVKKMSLNGAYAKA